MDDSIPNIRCRLVSLPVDVFKCVSMFAYMRVNVCMLGRFVHLRKARYSSIVLNDK